MESKRPVDLESLPKSRPGSFQIQRTSHQFRALFRKSASNQRRSVSSTVGQIIFPIAVLSYILLMQLIFDLLIDVSPSSELKDNTNDPLKVKWYTPGGAGHWFHKSYDRYIVATSDSLADTVGELPRRWTEEPSGILENIPSYPFVFKHNNTYNFTRSPHYEFAGKTDADLSENIYLRINEAMGFPRKLFWPHTSMMPNPETKMLEDMCLAQNCLDPSYYPKIKPIRFEVPAAAVTFDDVSLPESVGITVQAPFFNLQDMMNGELLRDYWPDSHYNGERLDMGMARAFVVLQDMLKTTLSNIAIAGNETFHTAASMIGLPVYPIERKLIDIAGMSSSVMFPMAFSFLLPMYVQTLVMEKESKLLEVMKGMGLGMPTYWVVNYMFYFTVYLITLFPFLLVCWIFQVSFIMEIEPLVWITIFLLWGLLQVSFSFFVSTFFNNAKAAATTCKTLVWLSMISAMLIETLLFSDDYGAPTDCPWFYYLYPPFALFRGFQVLGFTLTSTMRKTMTMTDVANNDLGIRSIFLAMFFMNFVWIALAVYVDQVFPGEFGVPKHPLFFLDYLRAKFKGKKAKKPEPKASPLVVRPQEVELEPRSNSAGVGSGDRDVPVTATGLTSPAEEDSDVAAERALVESGSAEGLIVLNKIRREFPRKTGGVVVALNNISMHVERDMCYCLLGPNGAGKTTLINLLTGIYPVTSGTGLVGGLDLQEDMDEIRKHVGVCPQFDVLWPNLSVREHLLFYARLKGVEYGDESAEVEACLKDIGLVDSGHLLAKELSGGMKRRLSLGIAVIGNPEILFLDEPTTGLDPVSRRMVWQIVHRNKKGKCVLLTTHSMEEAEVLSDRIAMMACGDFKGLGTQLHLKSKFGNGFRLTIASTKDMMPRIMQFVAENWPAAVMSTTFQGAIAYEIPTAECQLSELFKVMEKHKAELQISDWGISQSTLEDVFMHIVRDCADSDE